jgi:hypothetical protein
MNFLDRFVSKSNTKGEAATELPTDGASADDVKGILEGLSGLWDTGQEVVNGFREGTDPNGPKQVPVTPAPAPGGGVSKLWLVVGAVALLAVGWFLLRKR